MARGTVKRKPTPSAKRKKKAQQRIRKKSAKKSGTSKPSWTKALKKHYEPKEKPTENDGDEVQSDVDEEKVQRLNERQPLDTQLFLKNLPLDAEEDEVKQFFARFGDVKKVFLIRNTVTKMLSGTGFVHFTTPEIVTAVYSHAQQNSREVSAMSRDDLKGKTEGLSHHQAKKVKYKINQNVFGVVDPFVMIRNSRVAVYKVLSRVDSQELTSSMIKKKKRTRVAADDPRNLYLLQEGLISDDMPAAKGLPPRYLQMLQEDYEARKQQLRNVNMFVSKTRLSIRNVPRKMEENEVRKLVLDKVREFLKTHPEAKEKKKWGKHGPVKNLKLLKDAGGTSKGYAFAEFINHDIALGVLRALNNNPTLFGVNHRLVVSFSIENINAIQKLQRIRDKKKARLENPNSD